MSLITKPVSWRLNFKFHLFAHFSLGKAKAQRENQANALALWVEKFWARPGPSHPFRLQDQPFATRGSHRRDRGLLRSAAGEARLPTAHQARRHPLQISPLSVPTAAQESGLMVPILQMGKCTRQVARHRVGGTGIWTEVSSVPQTEDIPPTAPPRCDPALSARVWWWWGGGLPPSPFRVPPLLLAHSSPLARWTLISKSRHTRISFHPPPQRRDGAPASRASLPLASSPPTSLPHPAALACRGPCLDLPLGSQP